MLEARFLPEVQFTKEFDERLQCYRSMQHRASVVLTEEENVEFASLLILDALHGRKSLSYRGRFNQRAIRAYKIFHSFSWRIILSLVCVFHMALIILEPWVTTTTTNKWQTVLCESVFALFYVTDLSLLRTAYGTEELLTTTGWGLSRLALLALLVADLTLCYVLGFQSFRLVL